MRPLNARKISSPLDNCLSAFLLFLPARVLSSELIVRPHRAKISDKLLESLVYGCQVFTGHINFMIIVKKHILRISPPIEKSRQLNGEFFV